MIVPARVQRGAARRPPAGGRVGVIWTDARPTLLQNMLGAGLSTSPSNAPQLRPFPLITVADNVRLQARTLLHLPR